jgi:HSP20 family protein
MRSLIPWGDKSNVPAKSEDFFDPFVSFRREVDRMFDDFFSGFGSRPMERWHGGPVGLSPVIDVDDGEKELVVTAELPGLNEKDFEVTLAGDVLTIKGEKKVENESRNGEAHYVERRFGSFSRSVRLPFEASDSQVGATYEKGVLSVRVPKPADAQKSVRRIEVKASP